MSAYETWPFDLSARRSALQNERWWSECYLPASGLDDFQAEPDWNMIVGAAGAGKSIALEALARYDSEKAFILTYPPERWPGGGQEYIKGGNHLSQIMALVANAVRDELKYDPGKLSLLSKTRLEFLRWMLQKRLGERAVNRLLEEIDPQLSAPMARASYTDIYATDFTPRDMEGQIEELADLAQALKYERVVILMDVTLTISQDQLSGLINLFSWLKLMEHPGFAVAVAFPKVIFQRHQIGLRTRSRARIFELEWLGEQMNEIAARFLSVATNKEVCSLERLASPELLQRVGNWLLEEYGEPAPQGWVNLSRLLLDIFAEKNYPLGEEHFREITYRFYKEYMPLCFDLNTLQPGVWRGPRFIPLDEQPFQFLKTLSLTHLPAASSPEKVDRALIKVAGSKGNVHTLARRARLEVEPDLETPIYIKNTRREGYWLEHCVNAYNASTTGV